MASPILKHSSPVYNSPVTARSRSGATPAACGSRAGRDVGTGKAHPTNSHGRRCACFGNTCSARRSCCGAKRNFADSTIFVDSVRNLERLDGVRASHLRWQHAPDRSRSPLLQQLDRRRVGDGAGCRLKGGAAAGAHAAINLLLCLRDDHDMIQPTSIAPLPVFLLHDSRGPMVTTIAAHPQQAVCFGDPVRSGNDGAPIGSTSPSELERPFGTQGIPQRTRCGPFFPVKLTINGGALWTSTRATRSTCACDPPPPCGARKRGSLAPAGYSWRFGCVAGLTRPRISPHAAMGIPHWPDRVLIATWRRST
jgi:hypothetical protein